MASPTQWQVDQRIRIQGNVSASNGVEWVQREPGSKEIIFIIIKTNTMNYKGKKYQEMLELAWEYCVENQKSTEFTIQYLQDFAGVTFDTAIDFYNRKIS